MFGRFLAAAAVAGVILAGVPAVSYAQASGGDQTKSMPMKKGMTKKSMGKSKKSMEGHKMDNIADKLNACQAMPQADRQSCMSKAMGM